MSIIRCEKHDITWDSDTWDNCPTCLQEMPLGEGPLMWRHRRGKTWLPGDFFTYADAFNKLPRSEQDIDIVPLTTYENLEAAARELVMHQQAAAPSPATPEAEGTCPRCKQLRKAYELANHHLSCALEVIAKQLKERSE